MAGSIGDSMSIGATVKATSHAIDPAANVRVAGVASGMRSPPSFWGIVAARGPQ